MCYYPQKIKLEKTKTVRHKLSKNNATLRDGHTIKEL